MRSRRTAITASLLGALLIAGAPTLAFGEGDSSRDAKAYSAAMASDDATSDEVAAQKAKDEEKKAKKKDEGEKKAASEKKKDGDSKQSSKKKDGDNKQAAPKKKADDDRQAAQKKKEADERQAAEKKKAEAKKKDGDKKKDQQASDRKRHDNNGKYGDKRDGDKRDGDKWDGDKKKARDEWSNRNRHDHDRKGHHDKDEWKRKGHKDRHNKHWDHDRDHGRRHHYGWDTDRRYYRYGYYGPGYYDECGYNGGYNDSYYYGPDACRYEYGGYRSNMLVDMSWDQVIPRTDREAYGVANLEIDAPAGMVCFRLAYDGIDRAIGAQIHPGRIGEVGPSIVLLHVGQNGDDGCVGADPAILHEIQNDPRGYYLEVNDEQYGQAMRGQLEAPDYRGRY